MRPAMARPRIPDVPVVGRDVEIAADHEWVRGIGGVGEPACQALVPGELGLVERSTDHPAIGSINAHQTDAVASPCDHARLGERLVVPDVEGEGRMEWLAEI